MPRHGAILNRLCEERFAISMLNFMAPPQREYDFSTAYRQTVRSQTFSRLMALRAEAVAFALTQRAATVTAGGLSEDVVP